jgi:hypothetical protein
MPRKTLQKIDVFISSPGDVQPERDIVQKVIERLNDLSHIAARYVLKPYAWEKSVPAVIGESPQKVVDKYMLQAEHSDLFIGILWSRMGTPVLDEVTGKEYQSGTEYEFIHAYNSYQAKKKPQILLYRSMQPIAPTADFEQAAKVQAFFKRFEGKDAEFKGLYRTYKTLDEFDDMIFQDLEKLLADEEIAADENDILPPAKRQDFIPVSMPVHFVPRSDLLNGLRSAILTPNPHVALTSSINFALQGMGGHWKKRHGAGVIIKSEFRGTPPTASLNGSDVMIVIVS